MSIFPWQQTQWQRLSAAIDSHRLPHGLLLVGPRGIGLTQFSQVLAARLLCRNITGDHACGACNACVLLESGNHPDLNFIQPEETGKQIKVEQIRDLIDFIQLKSHYGQYKVAIIDPADAMNRTAANALLKTLEEPPASSVMILNTHEVHRLPVTIRSRCQVVEFNLMHDTATTSWLESHLEPNQDAELLLALAGAPLAALELIEEDQIRQREQILNDLISIRGPGQDPVEIAKRWTDLGTAHVLEWLQRLFMDMLMLKIAENPPAVKNTDLVERLRPLLNGVDLLQLLSCSQLLARIYAQQSSTVSYNSQALLEEFVLFWHTIETSGGISK